MSERVSVCVLAFTDLSGVSEHVYEVEVGGERDLAVLELFHPVPVEQPPVLLVEGTRVG